MRRLHVRVVFLSICAVFVGAIIYFARPAAPHEQRLGVTFSTKQALSLHLDPHIVLKRILEELGVRQLRIVAYWDDLEPTPGAFFFSELDWQLDTAAAHNATVVVAIGRKVPRWPECFVPAWLHTLSSAEQDVALERLLVEIVDRYDNRPEIIMWQLENEPFVSWFGYCPSPVRARLDQELLLLREHTAKPVLITDSGELSLWSRAAAFGDRFGTTIYRTTWNKYIGYWTYPLPAWVYRAKARLVGLEPQRVIIAELQAEPWPPGVSLIDASVDEQLRSMDIERMNKQILFAKRTGFGDAYLWGVEWWYWMQEHGHPEFWERGKELFQTDI